MRIFSFFSTTLLLTAAVTFSAHGEGKKLIGHGWDLLSVTPAEVLANADAFDQTALDGVTLSLRGKGPNGKKVSYISVLTDPVWEKEYFANEIPIFHAIVRHPSLRHSFLTCFWSPSKRLLWTDDTAWATAASNMAVVAWVAKAGNLAGIVLDPEDYTLSRQYTRLSGDPDFSVASALARKRGAQVMRAMAKENPKIALLSFWFFSASVNGSYYVALDPMEEMRQKGDLWPSFLNGLLDELPPEGKLIDGDEGGYNYEAEKRDFYFATWRQKEGALPLVEKENRTKFLLQSLPGSGHYMDKYTNPPGSPWYFGPLNGSRLEHFSLNVQQALFAAGEYIWLYGEKYAWIHWKNLSSERFINVPTWEDKLPGVTHVLKTIKTPGIVLRDFLEKKRAEGGLTNLAPNSECKMNPPLSAGIFHEGKIPNPYGSWQDNNKTKGIFGLDTGTGFGDSSSLCVKGVKNGCFTYYFRPICVGQCFAVEVYVKGSDTLPTISWQKNGKWDWSIPSLNLYFEKKPEQDGWRKASTVVRVPCGADTFVLLLNVHQKAGESAWFDRIAIYPLDL